VDFAVESFVASPDPVSTTQFVNFVVTARALNGPALSASISIVLPSEVSFLGCNVCNAPGTPNGGTATSFVENVAQNATKTMIVTARVLAPSGTTLSSTATITSSNPDTNPGNNSANATAKVAELIPFAGATKISMSSQGAHVLVLRGGTVWAWGHNLYGQLGDGTNNNRSFPAQVDDLMNVKDLSAGGHHSIALKTDGTVWTWGTNENGQLGIGTATPISSNRPVKVTSLSGITAVSAGVTQVMALKSDGTVWTWGWNANGELGIGFNDFAPHPTPTQVPGLTNVVRVIAGDGISYAIKADGTVFGWGFAVVGKLGDGQAFNTYTSPIELPLLKNMVTAGSGPGATVAIKQDQTVWSFGINGSGRLGRGIIDNSIYPVPTQIPDLLGKAVASGILHSIVALPDGTVRVFGGNDSGQLGLGPNDTLPHHSPTFVPGIGGVFAVAAGSNSTFVVIGDPNTGGTIQGWGGNEFGVLGIGSTFPSNLPSTVPELLVVAKPIFSVPEGTIFPTQVQIVCGTPESVIHYTTNGSDPTESDPVIASGALVPVDHSLTLKARAFRSGFATSAVKSAVYTVVPPPPLELLLDSSGPAADQLTAFDSVAFLRDPFPVVNLTYLFNLPDPNSRIVVFARNVMLAEGETAAAVTVNLVGSNSQSYDIPAVDVRAVANMDFVQITFRLPDNLAAGTCTVRIKLHSQTSNAGTMRIKAN